ncbi:MAG: hypothetical protein HY788_20040 [Deltaproteobacteria bacterium]|nr:hypothetical protein [Deltaproteobacteria bacterium]
MESDIQTLLKKAFRIIPGEDFNQVRYLLTNDAERPLLVCEGAIPKNADWETVKSAVYPPLCRYFKGKRVRPDRPENCIVALFYEGSFHLIQGVDFVDAFMEIEGIDRDAFAKIVSSWLDPTPVLHLPSP